jgi:hypothetical protein
MCGFYDDEQKIKKGDKATYQDENITIILAKHIKQNKTMDITYIVDSDVNKEEKKINIPYKTSGYGINLRIEE